MFPLLFSSYDWFLFSLLFPSKSFLLLLKSTIFHSLFEVFLYGQGAAASFPANIIQGISGRLISQILYPVLCAVHDVKRMLATNSGSNL